MMQAAVFSFQPTTPIVPRTTKNLDEPDRRSRISAVQALLDGIRRHEPSRGDLIQVIGVACGALNDACAHRRRRSGIEEALIRHAAEPSGTGKPSRVTAAGAKRKPR